MYYILALFYHKNKPPSIHGLWPQYTKDTWPEFSDPKRIFDIDKIKDLRTELDKYWWSYNKNEDFWKHEYLKHGTYGFKHEHNYFKTALECYKDHVNNKEELNFYKHGHNIFIEPSEFKSLKI